MGILKNGVGRPSNEIIKKRNIIKVISIFLVLIVIGIIIFMINKGETKVDTYTINMTDEKVNSELKNVYKFIWSYDDNTITAVTTNNKKIEIAKNVENVNSLSLYNGKLYFNYDYFAEGVQVDTRIAYIDLTKGNRKYKKSYTILTKDSIINFYKFGIIDNIIYFIDMDEAYIKSYDLDTGKINIIAGAEVGSSNIGYFDKKYKKFYYRYNNYYDENGNYIEDDNGWMEYDIHNKIKKEVIPNKDKTEIHMLKNDNHKIYYFKKNLSHDEFYVYDIKTSETKKLDSGKEIEFDSSKYYETYNDVIYYIN